MLNDETSRLMTLPNPFDLRSYLLSIASDEGEGGDENDDKGGDDKDDKSGGGGDDKSDKGGSSSGGSTKGEEDEPSEAKLRSDEAAKYRRERNEARERAEKAERDLEEKNRKERSELENTQKDRDTFKEQAETLATENTSLKVKVALFESGVLNSLKDPSDAERYLTFSDFVDKDGDVKADELKKKLDALKKDKSYLFRGEDEDEDETGGQPSGSKPKQKKQGSESTDEALRKKFPALAGR